MKRTNPFDPKKGDRIRRAIALSLLGGATLFSLIVVSFSLIVVILRLWPEESERIPVVPHRQEQQTVDSICEKVDSFLTEEEFVDWLKTQRVSDGPKIFACFRRKMNTANRIEIR